MSHYVYTCLDAEGGVLFVGTCTDPADRRSAHRIASAWGSEILALDAERVATVYVARLLAAQLTEDLQPRYSDLDASEVEYAEGLMRRLNKRLVPADNGCLIWIGAHTPPGYGRIQAGGRQEYTHRAAYMAVRGPIPAGLSIDHLCRTPACANVDHLEAVTPRENTLRSPTALAAVNARKTHCNEGHEFTDENTYVRPCGYRMCRTCKAARVAERRAAA